MKLLLTLLMLTSGITFAQLNEEILNHPEFEYPIYPKCKKFKGNNEKLNECFQKNVWFDLRNLSGIKSFDYYENNVEGHRTRVFFTIGKEGELKNLSYTEDSNSTLAKDILKQILKNVNYHRDRNKKIIPAKFKGNPVEFTISMPVTINYN